MDTMDHSEVRELLEDAAIEPGGLGRLMAGDTPTASIVAGHLAGCADCAEELERLRRSVGLIRPTVRSVPPPELKERTLAYVAALGRPRGEAAERAAVTTPIAAPVAVPSEIGLSGSAPGAPLGASLVRRRDRTYRLAWLAGLAAALIVGVSGTALIVNAGHQATSQAQAEEIDALGDVARWTLRVDAQPDVRRIELASATGASTRGSVVFSPTSTELVVVADDLTPAAAGHEYRCWVEVGGVRQRLGRMYVDDQLGYWVGEAAVLADLPSGTMFGVSLADLSAPGSDRPALLLGSLQST